VTPAKGPDGGNFRLFAVFRAAALREILLRTLLTVEINSETRGGDNRDGANKGLSIRSSPRQISPQPNPTAGLSISSHLT
jgi:hypothetical protein